MTDSSQEFDSLRASGAWRIWKPLHPLHKYWNGYAFHFVLMTIISLVGLAGYHWTLGYSVRSAAEGAKSVMEPLLDLDMIIPALPWTIFVYMTLYFYFPLPILAATRDPRGRREILFLAQGMVLLFLVSYGFFIFMPAEVVVRTQMESLLDNGMMHPRLASVFELVYFLDRPWNSWPSLHVSESLLIVLFVHRWLGIRAAEFPSRRIRTTLLWAAWISLSLSILTTKQHFIWDMLTGAFLSALIWWSYILPRLEQRAGDSEPSSVPSSA